MSRIASSTATLAVLLLLLAAFPAAGLTYDFALSPEDGSVFGPANSTVGWGFRLTNNSTTQWLVTTGLNASGFVNGIPELLFSFPILAPQTALMVPFDLSVPSGLYALTWFPDVPTGTQESGEFTLSAEWWDGDPQSGGSFLFAEQDLALRYQAEVTDVPEPATAPLAAAAVVLFALARVARPFRRAFGARGGTFDVKGGSEC